jgi:hypothetical protein
MIDVNKKDENIFEVTIDDNGSKATKTVTLDDKYHKKTTGGIIPKEETIRKSIEFLLEREPKESIMSKFNLKDIVKFFPEFESYISMEH